MKLVLVETKEDKSHLNTALAVCILWLGSKKIIKKYRQKPPESWGAGAIITGKGI